MKTSKKGNRMFYVIMSCFSVGFIIGVTYSIIKHCS